MTLFILTETSAGYALLKAKDKKLLKRDDLEKETQTAEGVSNLLKLKNFQKFDSATTALEEVASLVEGKVTPRLASLLESIKDEKKVSLAVADPKLGNAIGKLPGLSIQAIADSTTADLYRAIRAHLPTLIPGLLPTDMSTMALGLSHSLARHKLKFSPDKIDTMIVQAIALLDDLDKELNTYAMRVKEWYGWHFPEMAKILNDNMAYAKVVLKMGMRSNSDSADLSEILPEEIEGAVKAAANRSMGTDISNEDLENIQCLAEQVVGFAEYRQQLASYLTARSLVNLSKSPASTIQILGAEKALFRALKTKHDTPKYGPHLSRITYRASHWKDKGKMARVLAAKAAIGLAEWEKRCRRPINREREPLWPKKWDIKEARKHNPDADGLTGDEPAATENVSKKSKKDKKLVEEIKDEEMKDAPESEEEEEASEAEESEEEKPKKSKKKESKTSKGKDSDEAKIEELAEKAGLSVKRYLRKLERGEINFDEDGNPTAISKKELKKAKKEAKKAEKDAGKKRKRDEDEEPAESKSEKKKKKKSKA
ncbi:nucleolar protein 5A [Coccidioides immitis RMSCC 3703]|uniref:Nucleolar protein 58 n=1 Tax=Coccidioides immitis RMSCC 3703 TaxID=454286 RepID=A0A0J8QH76_COCIT|nr:nucleolar protein 5A [Coccidioides immitis RMSCC 3703]